MSKRLLEMMRRLVALEGPKGKAKLMAAVGKSERTIDRYMAEESKPPSTSSMRDLALACGASEREADELALESLNEATDPAKAAKAG